MRINQVKSIIGEYVCSYHRQIHLTLRRPANQDPSTPVTRFIKRHIIKHGDWRSSLVEFRRHSIHRRYFDARFACTTRQPMQPTALQPCIALENMHICTAVVSTESTTSRDDLSVSRYVRRVPACCRRRSSIETDVDHVTTGLAIDLSSVASSASSQRTDPGGRRAAGLPETTTHSSRD